LNYLQKPNIQKFKYTLLSALKLLSTIVSGHKRSPGDTGQGEDYPVHLTVTLNNARYGIQGRATNYCCDLSVRR